MRLVLKEKVLKGSPASVLFLEGRLRPVGTRDTRV